MQDVQDGGETSPSVACRKGRQGALIYGSGKPKPQTYDLLIRDLLAFYSFRDWSLDHGWLMIHCY